MNGRTSPLIATACPPFQPAQLGSILKREVSVRGVENQTICSRPQALEEASERELAPQEWEVWQQAVASAVIFLGVSIGIELTFDMILELQKDLSSGRAEEPGRRWR